MARTYCFRCRSCDLRLTGPTPGTAGELNLPCVNCGGSIVRDYRAENVAPTIQNLKREREKNHTRSSAEAQKSIFLPEQHEFRTPEDPTGRKGMHNWLETHQPKPSNKSPVYPDYDKTVLSGYTGKEK